MSAMNGARWSGGKAMWAVCGMAALILVSTAMAHRAHGAAARTAAQLVRTEVGQFGVQHISTLRPGAPDSARIGPLFGSDGHHCTASVVGQDLILTAAHCTPSGKDFVPGYRAGRSPYGWWHVISVIESPRWNDDDDEDYDVAFATVAPHGREHLGDIVGYNDLAFSPGFGRPVTVTGYPTDESHAVFGQARTRRYNSHQMQVRIPGLSGGTSGGPWVTPDGAVIGVIGGHLQGGDDDDVSYSVYFDDRVRSLYDDAAG